MGLTTLDFIAVILFSIYNILIFKQFNKVFSNKDFKVMSGLGIGIISFNITIFILLTISFMNSYVIFVMILIIYYIEINIIYKRSIAQRFLISLIVALNYISLYIFSVNILTLLTQGMSSIKIIRYAFILTLILNILFYFVLNFINKESAIDILSSNKIQLKITTFLISTFAIFNILFDLFYTIVRNSPLYNLVGVIFSFSTIISTYVIIVYSYKISVDIWKAHQREITSSELKGNSNVEFDLSMYNNIDVLSGFYNKEYGFSRLQEIIDSGTMFSAVFINLNSFLIIKKEHGQEWSDKYIKAVSSTLRSTYRDNDTIFRYGDNMFMVILENCNSIAADKTTSRAYNRVRQYAKEIDYKIDMSISFMTKEYQSQSITLKEIEDTFMTKMTDFNLKKNSIIDSATGCYNKKFGLNILEDMCYKKFNFVVCIFNINQLNVVAKMYGQHQVDSMLSIIGNIGMDAFRASDTVVRFNEKQFIAIMPKCESNEAKEVFMNFRKTVLEDEKVRSKEYGVDMSYKFLEFFTEDAMMPPQLFKKVEEELLKQFA
ncbi:MAG: diguanylate cyclase domain-containing protein [Oscillospiraceae bacterium]